MNSQKASNLTVVVPTFNEEDFIADCLEALQNQTLSIQEIIVVDNNSTDKTLQIVKNFSNIRVLSEAKQGQIFARNLGFNHAKSTFIATVDADSVPSPKWAEEMIAQLQHEGLDAISGHVLTKDAFAPKISAPVFNFFIFKIVSAIQGYPNLFASSLVMTKSFWQSIRHDQIMTADLFEDIQWSLIAKRKNLKIAHMRKQLVNISSRRGDDTVADQYRYLLRWSNTYKQRKMTLTYILSKVTNYGILALGILYKVVRVLSETFSQKVLVWLRT